MKATPRPQFPFETASLLLFAALSLGHGTAAWAYSAEPGRKAQALRAWQPDSRPAPERYRPDGDGAPIPSA
jgi:hypothetical protein